MSVSSLVINQEVTNAAVLSAVVATLHDLVVWITLANVSDIGRDVSC